MRQILFTLYILLTTLFAFSQTEKGKASYYADKFNGRKTASGEVFDNNQFTGAHPSLPFNTLVKVTNLDNGKSTSVRINDRGPFVKGRIIDVSKAAAIELDMLAAGVAHVEIEVMRTDEPILAVVPPKISTHLFEVDVKTLMSEGFGVQVVSFQYIDNLFYEIIRIEEEYHVTPMVHASVVNGTPVYRLILGPYDSREKAERKARKLNKKGKDGFVVDLENLK